MSKFDNIRFYHDSEVNDALVPLAKHPIFRTLLAFIFPHLTDIERMERLMQITSIEEFQHELAYPALLRVLEKSSNGLTNSGFEKLEDNTPYLYISNHRDILMDTSLLNLLLKEKGKIMTASAIGDNLVQKQFLMVLAKVNRNFLVRRGLSPRELLESSKLLSEYIGHLLLESNQSVWIAQREGRTKDGNDETNPGLLKMISMAADNGNIIEYFKKLKIVPVSISYEYDPTDAMKMPQLIAQANDEVYIKEKNEDFLTIYSGIIGQKKGIHYHIGDLLDKELDVIAATIDKPNKQLQAVANLIDRSIVANYKLWPTNYIAYDILFETDRFVAQYTAQEKQLFIRRLELRVDKGNQFVVDNFLAMYANPVVNQLKLQDNG